MEWNRLPIVVATMVGFYIADRSSGEVPPPIDELVTRLANSDRRVRDEAIQLLEARGAASLPLLRQALNDKDENVRAIARSLIELIETKVALAPKRLNGSFHKQRLSAILKEIESQSGYRLTSGSEDPLINNIEFHNASFWKTIDSLCQITGLDCSVNYLENKIELQRRNRSPFRWCNDAFYIAATKIDDQLDVDFTESGSDHQIGKRDRHLSIHITIHSEPRFLIISLGNPVIQTAVDERDRHFVLAEPRRDDRPESKNNRSMEGQAVRLFLKPDNNGAIWIKELRGVIPIEVVAERNRVLVTQNLLNSKGTKFQIDGSSYSISRAIAGKRNIGLSIGGTVQTNAIESRWADRFFVEDNNGQAYRTLPSRSYRYYKNGPIELSFVGSPATGPPQQLFVENWRIVKYNLAFKFSNVPLP